MSFYFRKQINPILKQYIRQRNVLCFLVVANWFGIKEKNEDTPYGIIVALNSIKPNTYY